jgi:RNA polymerase sigma factor (sigma-70 family)
VKERIHNPEWSAAFSLEKAVEFCGLSEHMHQRKAMEALYKRFYGYILVISSRYVREQEDAEELVNECFVRIFSSIMKFDAKKEGEEFESMFKGWISRICVNVSIDFLRARKKRLSLEDLNLESHDSLTIEAADDLQVQEILNMLDQLPEMQRTIFNLYEVEGYSHEEIAKLLDIPEGTSRTYLMRAKKKMQAIYLAKNEYIELGK